MRKRHATKRLQQHTKQSTRKARKATATGQAASAPDWLTDIRAAQRRIEAQRSQLHR